MPPDPPDPGPAGPPKAGGKKVMGMDRTTLIIVAVALAVGIGWYILKSRKAAAAANTAATPAPTTGQCTDANGNPTPCEQMAGIDYSGQLSVLQTEIESMLAAQGHDTDKTPADKDTDTDKGGGTGTKTKRPVAPKGLHATRVTATSITAAWDKTASADGYNLRVTYQQPNGPAKMVKQVHTGGTSAAISGLHRAHTYGVHVLATSHAGNSPETSIVVKTPVA
jgi:hypothetical protein